MSALLYRIVFLNTCHLSSAPGPVVITPLSSFSKITITWEEPAMPNGIITDYEVSYKLTDSSQPATTIGTGVRKSLTTPDGQERGTSFTFTVRAFTSVGGGSITTITVSTLTRPRENIVCLFFN